MKTVSTLTLLGLFPALGMAQHPEDVAGAPQPVDNSAAWIEFQRQSGVTGWQRRVNPATGTPKMIYGPGLKIADRVENLEDARARAAQLLTRYSTLLGKGQSDFVEKIKVKVGPVYTLVYDQKYRGLDVITGRADVRLRDNGVVAMFGASAVSIPAGFSINPGLAAEVARTRADELILGQAGKAGRPAPRLVIWANAEGKEATNATLAWEVQIDERPAEVAVGKAYIDAANGTMLQFKNEVFDCSCGKSHTVAGAPKGHTARMNRGMELIKTIATPAPAAPKVNIVGRVVGWVNLGHNPLDPLSLRGLPNVLVTSPVGSAFTNSAGNFSIPYAGTTPQLVTAVLDGRHMRRIRVATGTQLSASRVITPGSSATITIGSSGMNQQNRSQTTTYWFTDDCNVWLRSLVGNTAEMNVLSDIDPRVNIASSCNAYYTANTINFYNESTTCNMTAYETVIQHEWGHALDAAFGGISQTDGLSEGWGDIICTLRSRQPIIGPNFRKSGSAVRTALNTLTYPAGGGVHQQGSTWMGFCWDVRTNLIASLGAAGETRCINIFVPSIVADAVNQPDAVIEVFILDDDDGNLNNGTPNYADLEAAALKRNLPYPMKSGSAAAKDMVYYNFDTGVGAIATNRATGATTPMFGSTPWTVPGNNGKAMLRGSSNSSSTDFNYVETDFKGPIQGSLTISWWMRERVTPTVSTSYLFGGLGSFRCFTGGVAGEELWLRAWGGTPDIQLPNVGATLKVRARARAGVCVALTMDAGTNTAQWYIDGAPHGAAITMSGPVDVAAVTNGFRIGKHTSNTSSSGYDMDDFRMVNRVATTAEITAWCSEVPRSLYYKFDRLRSDIVVNYGDNPEASTYVSNPGFQSYAAPGRYGPGMMRGSNFSTSAEFNYVDTGFNGPLHGSLSINWWMKQRTASAPGASLSYIWGGVGAMRCFTGGVAGTGLFVRNTAGTDIAFPGNIQTLAQASSGVCVGLTIDAASLEAQWYINGAPSGAPIAIPSAVAVAASTSSFKIGKHSSNSNSSAYDIDEFRLDPICASPVQIRSWCARPTAGTGVYGDSCGIALDSIGGRPTVGNGSYSHTIAATPAAPTNCLFVVGVTMPFPSFDMGIIFPALSGCTWHTSFDIQAVVGTPASGRLTIPGGIPSTTSLAGLHVDTQVLGFQGATPLQSNAVSHVIEIN